MAVLAQRVFAVDGTQKYLTLYKEEFVRSFYLDSNWRRMRFGILCAMNDSGSNLGGSSWLFIGLCSGTTYPFGDAATVRAIGYVLASGAGWTRTGGANPYYTPGAFYGVHRVAGVNYTANVGSYSGAIATNTGSTQRRSLLIFDFLQTNTDYLYGVTSANVTSDVTLNYLLNAMDNYPCGYNGLSVTGTGQSLGGSSSATLDTVDILWNDGANPFEIYAMSLYKYWY